MTSHGVCDVRRDKTLILRRQFAPHTAFGSVMLSDASRHFFALFELTNAGILLLQGGIGMTGGDVFLYG
jgi:hypothetical protein